MRVPLSSVPDPAQMYVESGLAEVSPAPPVIPASDVGVAVAGADVAAGAVVAVGAVVAGTVTKVVVPPHPAAARAASPNTHDAMRWRV